MSEPVRLARGCWVSQGEADDFRARCASLLALAPAHSVLVGLTAARLHNMWLPSEPACVHVAISTPGVAPSAMTRPRRPELHAHRRVIRVAEITMVDGLPVTTPGRTWRDLATDLSLPDLVAAGDSILRGGISAAELGDVMRQLRTRPGARMASTAFPMLDAPSRSRPETHLRVALAVGALPPFGVNVAVTNDRGEWLGEPDLSCLEAKLALEYQGDSHAEVRQMRRDITRLGDFRKAGWIVLLFGPAEVFGRPWQIAPEVRQLIAERAPCLLKDRRGAGGRLRRQWAVTSAH